MADQIGADRIDLSKPAAGRAAAIGRVAADYLTLTKPPIISLLLVTAVGGMFLAAQGVPPIITLLLVCAGGALGAGGANAINHYLDQDIDALMSRTAQRPVPANRIAPARALAFGIGLNVAAFLVLAGGVNMLAAVLTLGATLFYVLVYTLWLKRTTPQNIVIGGAAGSIPPVVGWVAITGSFDVSALYLFTIIFFWTPPHFWALSLLIQKDYERAGVPMLPVVAGKERTVQSIFGYTLVLVALTLVFTASSTLGPVYLGMAAVLGAVLVWMAWQLRREQTARRARHLYLYSLLYLAVLFVAIMVDSVLAF
jgi:protoheme IX farnesyltransferase